MAGEKPKTPRTRQDRSSGAPEGKGDGVSSEAFPEAKYFDLKTQAVEDLVTADARNSPQVSAAELGKYRSGRRVTLADWLKAILIKAWFAGMVCYFFVWGLSALSLDPWDHTAVIALALGTVTNLLTDNVLRYIAAKPGMYDRWMMVTSPKIRYLPLDILYALLLTVLVLRTYNAVNAAGAAAGSGEALLGVEPILFAVFVTAWDLLFLGLKRLLLRIVSDARRSVGGETRR